MDGDRHAQLDVDVLLGPGEQRKVPAQQGALREDRERGGMLGQGGDDPGHETVASLCPLVRVGVGAQCDEPMRPGSLGHLGGEDFGSVDLDDDLLIEVGSRVEVEVAVRAPREAVHARV